MTDVSGEVPLSIEGAVKVRKAAGFCRGLAWGLALLGLALHLPLQARPESPAPWTPSQVLVKVRAPLAMALEAEGSAPAEEFRLELARSEATRAFFARHGALQIKPLYPGLIRLRQPVEGANFVQNHAYTGPLVQRGSEQGGDLRVLLSQKPGTPVAYGTAPVLTVALGLVDKALTGSVTLKAVQSGHLAAAEEPQTMTVAVGQLRIQ